MSFSFMISNWVISHHTTRHWPGTGLWLVVNISFVFSFVFTSFIKSLIEHAFDFYANIDLIAHQRYLKVVCSATDGLC